eukprot:CAMPEP_0180409410 /NCGR_PEP_ID=MMETSP0989-20121125/42828_1 /TAXON_ID=697907 /ORGANISM="non described non described, Strain CCMP2293" /LENGTH=419 /DNA_ID=CAMNT_0022413479 /DNA_START=53 /DNA_END=1308 /DNA_ORIENTATION=+
MAAPSLRSRSLLCAALASLLVTATLARVAPSDRNDLLKDNRVWLESRSANLLAGDHTTWRSASTQTRGRHVPSALGARTEGAHIRSAGEQPAHFVTYAGNKYATLDGAQPESNANECQNYFLPLPAGWQLATHDTDSIEVTKSHSWGTHVLVYADGGQRWTHHPDDFNPPGQEFGVPNALVESVDQPGWYKARYCDLRILIVSTPPTQTQTLPPWGQAGAFASCVLNVTWDDIIASKRSGSGPPFKTGGLGNLTQGSRFEVWLCAEGHACGDDFCFVFDEESNAFVPWAPNSQLRLFTPGTSGATKTPTISPSTSPPASPATTSPSPAGCTPQTLVTEAVVGARGGSNVYGIGAGGSYDLFFACLDTSGATATPAPITSPSPSPATTSPSPATTSPPPAGCAPQTLVAEAVVGARVVRG